MTGSGNIVRNSHGYHWVAPTTFHLTENCMVAPAVKLLEFACLPMEFVDTEKFEESDGLLHYHKSRTDQYYARIRDPPKRKTYHPEFALDAAISQVLRCCCECDTRDVLP